MLSRFLSESPRRLIHQGNQIHLIKVMTGIGSDYCNKHHTNCECCLMSLFIAMNSDSDAIELVWIARKVSGLFESFWETVVWKKRAL